MTAENIKDIVVIGGGIMGQGIAQSFAQAGLSVSVVDVDRERLDECLAQIDANLKLLQEFNLLEEDIRLIESRLNPVLNEDMDEALRKCDFVIEAVPENLVLKKQLFTELDTCSEHVILSSNTSSFTIPDLVEGLRTANRIIGVHFFNPAHIMPLVEIHYGSETSDKVVSTTKELMIRIGKKPILVEKEVSGFIVNRLQAALGREAMYLVEQGVATPEDIDVATRSSLGFRWANIGFFESLDMIGIDTLANVGGLFKELSNADDNPRFIYEMNDKGELGIKSGKGFYDYSDRDKSAVLDELNRRLLTHLAILKKRKRNTEFK